MKQRRMSAADDQPNAGKDVTIGRHSRREDVRLDVIGGNKRNIQRQRQHLGSADTNQQRSHETRRV